MAANETHPRTAPLAANGPNRQLGSASVCHDRHMMGGNPLYLDGLADDVTALLRVLRSLGRTVERNSQKSEPVRRWRSGSDFVISVYRKDYKIGATLKRGS